MAEKAKKYCAHCGEELVAVAPYRHVADPHPAGHFPEPVAWEDAPIPASASPEEANEMAPEPSKESRPRGR